MSAAVYIETYGCAFNQADSEALAGVLRAAGYRLADGPESADLVILNTCTVKDKTWREFEKRYRALRDGAGRPGAPRVVLAGCIPKANPGHPLLQGVSAIAPEGLARAPEVVAAALAGVAPEPPGDAAESERAAASGSRNALPTVRARATIEIVPIAQGCLSACAFCQTRLARGRLVSTRPGELLARARRALADGVRELWLTAQDTGAYGRDQGGSLPELVRALTTLEHEFGRHWRLRIGMSSPHWIEPRLADWLEALDHPCVFTFLHVPIQSGSDRVLARMRRESHAGQFLAIAEAFAARFPWGSLITDVIVGYPGETDEDFEATLDLLRRTRPAGVNRSRFSARPGTAAARLAPLASAVVSERSKRLMAVANALAGAYHARWIGRREAVLVHEARPNGTTLAHNQAYRPVVLDGVYEPGQWLDVRIHGAATHHLRGGLPHAHGGASLNSPV